MRLESEVFMPRTVQHFYDPETFTLTYVVFDPVSKDAVIIDPVWDYDPASSQTSTASVEAVMNFVHSHTLNVHYILETHAHADHLTGSAELKKLLPHAKVGVGKNITAVQSVFKNVFNMKDFNTDGVQFDILLTEDQDLQIGSFKLKTIFTPGHTPACSSYLIDDMLFTGDTLFMPDFGTGRCDFPAGSAEDMYHSVHDKLYKLPDETKVFTGHDYQPGGRALEFESTIGEHKQSNIQLRADTTKEEYVKFRTERDAVLKAPRLLLPSIQVNIDAGHLPEAEENGVSYIKIPVRKEKN
ncbi:MBL fold metallo-hydrolase [bacterium]|nr:MBL fold metallo-hydrolase [bacterium]